MGLLDFSGYVGDDTVKDEYGLTQADRRQPLFSGLIRGGMLAMAAGENISPGARAQLLGQMGGAYADIPDAMNKVKADAAQMQLRRQQYQTNQQKLEQAQKLRAYAQTPEFAEMIKDMPEFQKAGLKFLIESGDADSVQRLLSGMDAKRNDRAGIPVGYERDPANPGAVRKIPGYKDEGDTEGMAGKGERQQFQTWLMTEPPDSQRYARAHQYFSTEQRHNENGVWITQPAQNLDEQGYPKPSWTGRPGGTVGGVWPPPGAPAAGQSATNEETGLITQTSADGKTVTETDPKTGIKTVRRQGQPSQTEKPKPASDTEIATFHKGEAEAATLLKALEDYQAETTKMSDKDKYKSLADLPTAANMATALTQLLAKGEVLLNLGVLTGDDMVHIRRLLPDPSTFRGTGADYALAVKKVSDVIKFKMQFREKQVFPYGRPGKPDGGGPSQTSGALPTVTTKEAYDKLPPGTKFIGQDGQQYVKP